MTAIDSSSARSSLVSPSWLLHNVLPVIVAPVVILTLWQALVRGFQVDSFVLPAPTDIAGALVEEIGTILSASTVTVRAVLLGLASGVSGGVTVALLLARFRSLSAPILTVAVIVNCAPIVALAPIFNNWLGTASIASKAGVAAIMVFFPVLVNTTRGLLNVSALHLEVMESLAASPRQVTLWVRLPNALPYLFNGVKLGTTLSVIAVIVSEYFGGPADALGVYIAQMAALPRYAEAWAGILVSAALGLALFGLVNLLERYLMPWNATTGSGG
ncbi:NitT/TauT family transport system permease protein [Spinactinospora alkalitolerans]|uniref:NitT/TauT family transport system permease protein n=1 Tax=Spinactinospora alkalitolerans TaxID=687207 RepID=A0A852TTZ6_9ACTN|nr:ABC transporter permease [Spinactinospora alkalitolerans]NYE47131.1 NitT/TauT family transport system permease protein [Spinactinospora alkalitolerans]